MYIVYYDEKMQPRRVDTRRVVAYGDHDQPLLAAVELFNGGISVSHFKDESFARTLRNLGIANPAEVKDHKSSDY